MDADRMRSLLRERAGAEIVERLEHLDRVALARSSDAVLKPPGRGDRNDADVVFIGGGLSLLVAAEVARLGRRVIVLERARAGRGHREWNASDAELAPLVSTGLFSASELEKLVVARYDRGVCRFHGAPPTHVTGVLDRAVDAEALLQRVRSVAEARGVRFVDGATVSGLGAGAHGVRIRWLEGDTPNEVTARLVADARGASSPYASADLVCPTVGGVFRGLAFDPREGDILVTTEDADRGRQHVWEAFPGRAGELTVYLFYYAERPRAGTLMELYARFFDTLPSYRTGSAELLRPTFGYIPGWSRLTPAPRGPHPRVVLLGDAAARHSPLTFCGFGAMLRSFRSVAAQLAHEGRPSAIVDSEPIHGWTGLLARMLASEALPGGEQNALLAAAFASLAELGNEAYAALLQDRLSRRDFALFLKQTAQRHPRVYFDVLRSIDPRALGRWGWRFGRSALFDAA